MDDDAYEEDRQECLKRAEDAGLTGILNPGYDIASSLAAIDLSAKSDLVWAAIGIHPQKGEEHNPASYDEIAKLAGKFKVVAIGEIGLDYYWMKSPKQAQHEAFLYQIGLAKKAGLPILVHSRDAAQETFDVIRAHRAGLSGVVMHCYSGSHEMATEYVKMDCFISMAGPVTFKNARKAHEVASRIPLSHLLVETDGPYLSPEPFRGKRNEPMYVKFVAEKIAELKGISSEEVAAAACDNTKRLLGIG